MEHQRRRGGDDDQGEHEVAAPVDQGGAAQQVTYIRLLPDHFPGDFPSDGRRDSEIEDAYQHDRGRLREQDQPERVRPELLEDEADGDQPQQKEDDLATEVP